MLRKSGVDLALDCALSTGGDFAELFFEDRESNSISMIGSQIENVTYNCRCGAGIRVLRGDKYAYAHTSDVSDDGLVAAAKRAAALFDGSKACAVEPQQPKLFDSQVRKGPSLLTHDKRIERIRMADKAARAVSPEITQVSAGYADLEQNVLVVNTRGVWSEDRRMRTRFMVQAVAASGNETQTGYRAPGYTMGYEMFRIVDVEEEARRAAETAVVMLHAPLCPSAHLPVVIDGGFGGVIFHEACGHALEATSVADGNSVFCGKMGQRIASEKVSAVDDGTLPYEWGSINMDDEGYPSGRCVLIENGVLKGYMVDILGARKLNMPPTGNARRQSYEFAPTSRMTNTFILPGDDDEAEIISSLAEGLYAKSMGGGSVNPLTGEFNFSVREGYWVKNGKIDRPVRGATLIGSGAKVLLDIDRVGMKAWLDAGMCGSRSGQVPTCVGQPMIRVSGMTIGGNGEQA